MDHTHCMGLAIAEARLALAEGEVPVGAVAVHEGGVIARGHNRRETWRDPTAHAELLVLRECAARLGRWRLTGVTLYVTLEPCPMCAGAMWAARLDEVVFGASDPKTGAAGSLYTIPTDPRLNHQVRVIGGVLADECGSLLREFFASRRNRPGD
ncbi:MAG: tRNA adenosine(34) deaminase TadA [Bacillota bacterium]